MTKRIIPFRWIHNKILDIYADCQKKDWGWEPGHLCAFTSGSISEALIMLGKWRKK